MHAFSYAWSHNKFDIAKNLMIHANLVALSFVEPELRAIEVLHCLNMDFFTLLLL